MDHVVKVDEMEREREGYSRLKRKGETFDNYPTETYTSIKGIQFSFVDFGWEKSERDDSLALLKK